MTNKILSRIAYHLRAAKGGSGVTDSAAAELLGVAPSTVSYRLRAVQAPQGLALGHYLDLCEIYGVDGGEILTKAIEDARMGRGEETP